MTGWAADRHITPRVIAHLVEHLPDVPRRHRPTIGNAVAVLHAQCRWARREPGAEDAGRWLCDDTVGQIEAHTGLKAGVIRDVLAALERIGLNVTIRNGGGKGEHARGARRRLVLDPVDTPRANHAEYRPIVLTGPRRVLRGQQPAELERVLRGQQPAELERVLRGQSANTPRATPRTPRATARDSASSAFTTYPRVGDADEVSTTHDDGDARTTYEEYAAEMRATGQRVLSPAVYFAIVGEGGP